MIPKGERHRKQRKMLGPVFSTAHMRQMGNHIVLSNEGMISYCSFSVPIFYEVTCKVWYLLLLRNPLNP
jgi:hypothetical protein